MIVVLFSAIANKAFAPLFGPSMKPREPLSPIVPQIDPELPPFDSPRTLATTDMGPVGKYPVWNVTSI